MNTVRASTAFALLLTCLQLPAQSPPVHHYDVLDGLINNVVYTIDQDAFGRIWMGTEGGASVFDGAHFENYSVGNGLSSNSVVGFGAGRAGGMYVLHYARGLDHIGSDGKIRASAGANFPCSFGTIVDGTAYLLRMPMNTILQATLPADERIDAKDCQVVIRQRPTITRAAGEHLLTDAHHVWRATGNGLVPLYTTDADVYAAATDRSGTLWVMREDGLHNTSTGRSEMLHGVRPEEISALQLDALDRAWVVAGGRLYYDPGTRSLVDLSATLGIGNNTVNSIFRDREGNIWAATSGKGVHCFHDPFITTYAGADGLINNTVTAVAPGPAGSLLFGTRAGLSLLDTAGRFANSPITPYIHNIVEQNGAYVICSSIQAPQYLEQGGHRLQWTSQACVLGGSEDAYVTSLNRITRTDRQGNTRIVELASDAFMASDRIEVMRLARDGTLWVGARTGLYRIDPPFEKAVRMSTAFAPLARHVHDIWLDEDGASMYIAADGGLHRLHDGHWRTVLMGQAPWEVVFCIRPEGRDRLWVGTNTGIHGLKDDRIVAHFGIRNGMSGSQVLDAWIDTNKRLLWAGTDDGITRIDLRGWSVGRGDRTDVLVRRLADRPVLPGSTRGLVLDVGQSAFNVEMQAIRFDEPAMIEYAWWLDGKGDTAYTRRPAAFVQGIRPGEHRFHVRARKAHGNWGPTASVGFSIPTPVHQQWWFLALVTLALLLAITLVVRWRLARLARKTRRKLRIKEQLMELRQQALASSINPHFIFNALNGIQYLVGAGENDKAHDAIAKLGKLIRANLDSMRNGMTALDHELRRLRYYFELEQLRVGTGIQLHLDVPEACRDLHIPVMILQPFVENAIWHGLAGRPSGNIHVRFRLQGDAVLCITIEDDGIGIHKASTMERPGHRSIGTRHIAERLDMLNKWSSGSVSLTDLSEEGGTGTRVTLTLKPGCFTA